MNDENVSNHDKSVTWMWKRFSYNSARVCLHLNIKFLKRKHVFINKFFEDLASDQWRNWIKTAHFTFGWMERLLGSKSQKISLEELGYE